MTFHTALGLPRFRPSRPCCPWPSTFSSLPSLLSLAFHARAPASSALHVVVPRVRAKLAKLYPIFESLLFPQYLLVFDEINLHGLVGSRAFLLCLNVSDSKRCW